MTNIGEVMRVEFAAVAPDCAKYAGLATKGLGKGGHMGYNADGQVIPLLDMTGLVLT